MIDDRFIQASVAENLESDIAKCREVTKSRRRKTLRAHGYYDLPNGKFKAVLVVFNFTIYIGTFSSDKDASKAYRQAHKEWWGFI